MKAPVKKRIGILVAAVALIAIGVPAAPALASGFTLELSPPPHAVVGQPAVLHANGSIPQSDLGFSYWFSLDAIPVAVTTTCPADSFEGMQIAQSTGGANIVLTQREAADGAGNFSIPVGITPSAPGTVLLCGYTDDGETDTLAIAPLMLKIDPAGKAPSGGGSSSSGTAAIAAEVKSGVRSCTAVLSGKPAKSCIRRAVAHGKSRCRHLHGHKARAKCVRAVRRAGRS